MTIHLPYWVIWWLLPCVVAVSAVVLREQYRERSQWDFDIVPFIILVSIVVWTLAFWVGRLLP